MNIEAKKCAQVLSTKLNNETCAPFYILTTTSDQSRDIFIQEFRKGLTPLEDHPDIMTVDLFKDENSYKVDSVAIKKFQQFLNYNPLHLNKKIIFFHHAEKMNDTLANKLLKTLEELSDHFLLFFFVQNIEDVLPTVRSRAIKLVLKNELKENLSDENEVKSDLFNAIRLEKDKFIEHELTKQFVTQQINKVLLEQKFKKNDVLLQSLKHFELSQEYNNALLPRLSFFNES